MEKSKMIQTSKDIKIRIKELGIKRSNDKEQKIFEELMKLSEITDLDKIIDAEIIIYLKYEEKEEKPEPSKIDVKKVKRINKLLDEKKGREKGKSPYYL